MRYLLKCLIFIWFVFPLNSQTNRALIIAIGNYPLKNGWDETHAVNDCNIVIPMLKANGYKSSDIITLLNEQATKKNIVKELIRLAEKSKTQDHIYIHFSGHGQQMADDNGDEPDGLDEAFIPYDAYYRYVPGRYEGENHLRDDEIEQLIDRIRHKIGQNGNVMIVMDACHSGTGTRIVEDDDYIRGTSYIFAPPDFEPPQVVPETSRFDFHIGENLSPITVFSACQPDERNFEYKTTVIPYYYGSLSYFFCQTVNEKQSMDTNRSIYLRLRIKMNAYFNHPQRQQTPYFESTVKDNLFCIGK